MAHFLNTQKTPLLAGNLNVRDHNARLLQETKSCSNTVALDAAFGLWIIFQICSCTHGHSHHRLEGDPCLQFVGVNSGLDAHVLSLCKEHKGEWPWKTSWGVWLHFVIKYHYPGTPPHSKHMVNWTSTTGKIAICHVQKTLGSTSPLKQQLSPYHLQIFHRLINWRSPRDSSNAGAGSSP